LPKSITLHLTGDEKSHYTYNMASVFQSIMMDAIGPDYAGKLHQDGMHPYSQFLKIDNNEIDWTVNVLTEEASDHIINVLGSDQFQNVHLMKREEILPVIDKSFKEITYDDLIQKYYLGESGPLLRIRFLTPTAFKSDGKYIIYPTARLLFQNLMLKYDACAEGSSIYSDELVDEFEKYADIVGYRLRSTVYYISHAQIVSFLGDITIRIGGTRQLANIGNMLAHFGEFSGVGIKTGMGMGAMCVMEREG
jgi:CRISPR-associated endoribonuclease Cas6